MVYYNPHKTGHYKSPIYPKQPGFFHCSIEVWQEVKQQNVTLRLKLPSRQLTANAPEEVSGQKMNFPFGKAYFEGRTVRF